LAGALVGMLIAIPLGNIAVNLPILVGGVLVSSIAIALALVMPEHGFHPVRPEDRNNWQHMGDIFKKEWGRCAPARPCWPSWAWG